MALTKISEFKSSIKYGSRSNLFKVGITFPTITNITWAGSVNSSTGTNLDVLCKSAAIPSMTIGVVEVPFRGRRIKVPGDRTFTDWTATFYSDSEHRLRQTFLQWSDYIKNHNQTTQKIGASISSSQTDLTYYGAIDIQHLNSNGDVSRYYKLYEVFPTEIGAIDLSFDSTDALEEFTVTFQYQYMDSSSTLIS